MALPLNQGGVSAGQLLRPRYGLPYVVGERGFPPSLLAAQGLRPRRDELGELLEQLRVLAGLPKPVPPAASVPLAPPPPQSPRAVGQLSRRQARAGSGGSGPVGLKFRRQLGRVADFSASHGRLPSTGRGARADERRLGMWLYRQRRRHQDGATTREETGLLTQALGRGWAGTPRPGPEHRRSTDGAVQGERQGVSRARRRAVAAAVRDRTEAGN